MVREDTVDDEGVEGNDDGRHDPGDNYGFPVRDTLFDSVGVLDRNVCKGEMLVVWFDEFEDREGNNENAEGNSVSLACLGKWVA